MKSVRLFALVVVAAVLYGSLAVTAGYAWYIRSDRYRQLCAEKLGRHLALPSDIGQVVARSRRSRQFNDVKVWLPERRGVALHCREALIRQVPTPADPEAYDIEIVGGTCEISARTWLRTDYRRMVESGLRPGFSKDGPQRVAFSGFDLTFLRDRFKAELKNASGFVWFQNFSGLSGSKVPGLPPFPIGPPAPAATNPANKLSVLPSDSSQMGHAYVLCREINGYSSPEALSVEAAFSPQEEGIRLDRVEVTIPALPLNIIDLNGLIGATLPTGKFEGHLLYSETAAQRTLRVNGKCHNLELAELTAAYFPQPWRGRCPEIELEELRFENGLPAGVRFHGKLTGVVLGDLLAPLGWDGVGGEAQLDVRYAALSPAGIDRLIASGECVNVSLETLTTRLGWGRMSGNLRLLITDLTIEQNRLASLNAEILVADDPNRPNWIEGKLLREIISRALKLDLPPILPERVEYNHLSARLDVRDETLYLFGARGPHEKTLVQIRFLGKDFAIKEAKEPYPLQQYFDPLRARLKTHMEEQMRALRARQAGEQNSK